MNPIEIKPDIYWVGAIDWAVRDFHGYITPNGTTYNNYLIKDRDITLVDTVKHDFAGSTISNLKKVVDPKDIVNIVINHIEADHVSSLEFIMDICPNALIHITEKGKAGLARHYDISKWEIRTVKTGDTLNTGTKTLTFLETPMLHWPDSMVTYVAEDKLLISQDAFGQHLATSNRFDDEFTTCESVAKLDDAVIDYYANILMPFGSLIKKKLAEVQELGLDIDMIAPDHGVIWRRDVGKILNMYEDLANNKCTESVSIIYDTMWHSTELMTLPLMQGVLDEGLPCKVVKLRATPMSSAIKEFWKSRGTLIGSPTLNNIMFPSVAEFLTHLRGLRPKGRLVGAFGSFGWAGGAVREAYEEFEKMKLKVVGEGYGCKYRPDAEDEDRLYEFGREFARATKEYHKEF
jgi:flavorubredoxin